MIHSLSAAQMMSCWREDALMLLPYGARASIIGAGARTRARAPA